MLSFLQRGENSLIRVNGQAPFPDIVKSYGLLGPEILFSHGNGSDAEEAREP